MTDSATTTSTPRLYGGWRNARGWSLGNLSPGQTLAAAVTVIAPWFAFSVSVPSGFLALLLSAITLLVGVIPFGRMTLIGRATRAVRSSWAHHKGYTSLSTGVLTEHHRRHDLPGLLAPVVPLTTDDGRGGKQALLWHRVTGHLSAILRVSPVGIALADDLDGDQWVAHWGAWLADLGYRPMVRHVAVTIDTAPSGGTTVGDYVNGRIDPTAPPAALQVLEDLVASTPAQAADVDTRVTITFDTSKANPAPKDLLSAIAEVTHALPGMQAGLAACGAPLLERATTPWLVRRLRAAFDPASRGEAARLAEQTDGVDDILRWEDGAPLRAEDQWDRYIHDSGISVSWALDEAPRQAITSRVLVPLLAPGRFPRRVSLLYVPFPAAEAANEVEREINAGEARMYYAQKTKKTLTQRERDDAERAQRAAREEAEGAGLGRFTLWVTTTVTDEADLPAAVADVEQRAGQSKLRLRRVRGAQAAAFAAGLGVGIDPAQVARLR